MQRTQFTFYESFSKALSRIKKKADRADAYDAICNYALYGVEPDMEVLPESVAIAFDLIRPTLESSWRKAEMAKKREQERKFQREQEEAEAARNRRKAECSD